MWIPYLWWSVPTINIILWRHQGNLSGMFFIVLLRNAVPSCLVSLHCIRWWIFLSSQIWLLYHRQMMTVGHCDTREAVVTLCSATSSQDGTVWRFICGKCIRIDPHSFVISSAYEDCFVCVLIIIIHFIYIALFKVLKVSLQSPVFIQTQSYRWCRSVAAQSAPTAPSTTTNIHSTFIQHSFNIHTAVGDIQVP